MNTLSVFGRMSYGAHMVTTALLVGSAATLRSHYAKISAESAEKELEKTMPKAKSVDPDIF